MSKSMQEDTTEERCSKNSGEPYELKGSRTVRRGAIGKAGKAARWLPTLQNRHRRQCGNRYRGANRAGNATGHRR